MIGILHRGWFTKSPPEKKLGQHIKLFRAKWKKRFFVLTVKDNRHELNYYKDQSSQIKKGSINLKDCQSVKRVLQPKGYPNLLALKTISKNKPRTYYLAAENSYEIDTWLHWLHLVCGIKGEEESIASEELTNTECQEYNPPTITLSRASDPQNDSAQCSDVSVHISPGEEVSEDLYAEVNLSPTAHTSTPQFEDFIKYLNENLTVADKLGDFPLSVSLSGSNTSMETKTGLDQQETNFDQPIYSNDQRHTQDSRGVSDYDVPRSSLMKRSPPVPPPACRRSNLVIHTYVNTAPMAHLVNPEI